MPSMSPLQQNTTMAGFGPTEQHGPVIQMESTTQEHRIWQDQPIPRPQNETRMKHAQQATAVKPGRPISQTRHSNEQPGHTNGTRHDFSPWHGRAYFLLCILSIAMLGCALTLVCTQALYQGEPDLSSFSQLAIRSQDHS